MKLCSLTIKRLYGHYDYENIIFNSDVTFIYGLNGCGKTTILNITEAIITGQIFKLFSYDFEEITLKYSPNEEKEIVIKSLNKKLDVTFENKTYTINQIERFSLRRYNENDFRKIKYYFTEYKFLESIKNTFNYVYLPLNRSLTVNNLDFNERIFQNERNIFDDEIFEEPISTSMDIAMLQIEELIEKSCRNINLQISKISDKFRNDILKSSLRVNEQYKNLKNIYKEIEKIEIEKTKIEYIKILKSLNIITESEEKNFIKFFDEVSRDITQNENNRKVTQEILLKVNEVIKIKEILSLADETERKKADIRKPLEKFIEVMNKFIYNKEDEKLIQIDQIGQVYFTTKNSKNKIGIGYLSSGEKQLMIFFANLLFKVDKTSSGIFVVDEPELSLHLHWQKIFVKTILKLNNRIQLIFATHAPEIIGEKRNKMFKLEKKYID